MIGEVEQVQAMALKLPALEKAHLVERLLSSLDQPDSAIAARWKKEVEERIQAHRAGKIKSVSLAQVLAKYGKRK